MQREEKEEVIVKDASKYRVGIAVSTYYSDITDQLLNGAITTLSAWGVSDENMPIVRVTGSFELPYGCLSLLTQEKVDAVIALGVIIKGETDHDQYIAHAVANGIMELTVKFEKPISFGVVTVNNLDQAIARSTGTNNKGAECAIAVLEAAMLKK